MRYSLDKTAKDRLDPPPRSPDGPAGRGQPEESRPLNPAIGLLIAVGLSTLFWTVVTSLRLWWIS